jgi:hypothetical protein
MGWVINVTPRLLYPRYPVPLVRVAWWSGLEGCGKYRPLLAGFDPQTVRLTASCYSDYDMPPHCAGYVRIFTLEQIYRNVSRQNDGAVTACDTEQFLMKLSETNVKVLRSLKKSNDESVQYSLFWILVFHLISALNFLFTLRCFFRLPISQLSVFRTFYFLVTLAARLHWRTWLVRTNIT